MGSRRAEGHQHPRSPGPGKCREGQDRGLGRRCLQSAELWASLVLQPRDLGELCCGECCLDLSSAAPSARAWTSFGFLTLQPA